MKKRGMAAVYMGAFYWLKNGDALPAAMGRLREGRAVFRREDRCCEKSVVVGRRWSRVAAHGA